MMIDHDFDLDHESYAPFVMGSIEDEDVMEGVLELLQGDDLSEWQDQKEDMSSNYVPAPTKASALPNSVTTSSCPDPSVPSRLFNLQLATGFVPSPKQSYSPVPYATFKLPSAIDGPHDGFTLPSSFGLATAALNVSTTQPTATVPLLRELSSPLESLLQGYSSDPSDCRSSLNVLNVKKSTGCRRRSISDEELTQSKNKYRKVEGGKVLQKSTSMTEISPQTFFDKMIQARGYSTDKFCSLEGGYFCSPTALQQASFGVKVLQAVRTSDGDLLKRMLECGLSPNACSAFGESIVHMVCRRGDYKLLKILADAGCSFQVTDDFGRTPLHEACWTTSFDCVELILNADKRLLNIVDCRGSSPLSYIKREHRKQWIDFLESKADRYWYPRDVSTEGEEAPPPLVGAPPHSHPVPDPKNAIPVDVAALIASGKQDPENFLAREANGPEMKQVAMQVLVAVANE